MLSIPITSSKYSSKITQNSKLSFFIKPSSLKVSKSMSNKSTQVTKISLKSMKLSSLHSSNPPLSKPTLLLFLLFLLTLPTLNNPAHSQYPPPKLTHSLLGFQNIYLSDPISKILNILQLHSNPPNSKKILSNLIQPINPYLMLSKHFYYPYQFDAFPVHILQKKLFLSLQDLNVQNLNYQFSHRFAQQSKNTFKKDFFIELFQLQTLTLSSHSSHQNIYLQALNPLLIHLNLKFFQKKLFSIQYTLNSNLHQAKRLYTNFSDQFGPSSLKKIKKITQTLKNQTQSLLILSWSKPSFLIQAKIPAEQFDSLIQNHSKPKKIQFPLSVTLQSRLIQKKAHQYQTQSYQNLLDYLKQKLNLKISQLKKSINSKKTESKKIIQQKNYQSLQPIDQL